MVWKINEPIKNAEEVIGVIKRRWRDMLNRGINLYDIDKMQDDVSYLSRITEDEKLKDLCNDLYGLLDKYSKYDCGTIRKKWEREVNYIVEGME